MPILIAGAVSLGSSVPHVSEKHVDGGSNAVRGPGRKTTCVVVTDMVGARNAMFVEDFLDVGWRNQIFPRAVDPRGAAEHSALRRGRRPERTAIL